MRMSATPPQSGQFQDRRARSRSKELTNPMVVLIVSGGAMYQLKARDLSDEGAGLVVRADSNLLQRIEVGQSLQARVVLPRGYRGPAGQYLSRVEHITELQEGPFSGHMIVGLSFLHPITVNQNRFKKTR